MQKSAENSQLVWTWQGKSYSLPVTSDDIIMLARAMEYEGAPKGGVAWTLLQRWAWLHMAGVTSALSKFIQAYAQPLNPRWMYPNGDLYQKELAGLTNPADVSAAVAKGKARVNKVKLSWDKISDDTKQVLAAILNNNRKHAITGAVHYWASRGPDFKTNQERKPGLILLDIGIGFGPGRNVFFADSKSRDFGPTVRFQHGSGAWPSSRALGWLPVTMLTASVGYMLYRALSNQKIWGPIYG